MSPSLNACWDVRSKDLDYVLLRRLSGRFTGVGPNYLGDFYPLTDYSTGDDVWMAWQYHRPEAGEGVVQAFRRARAADEFRMLRLRGLEPDATYEIENVDSVEGFVRSGSSLMQAGLPVHLPEPESAAHRRGDVQDSPISSSVRPFVSGMRSQPNRNDRMQTPVNSQNAAATEPHVRSDIISQGRPPSARPWGIVTSAITIITGVPCQPQAKTKPQSSVITAPRK